MLCFIEGPDGLPHLAKGMVEAFEVGPADVAELPEPEIAVDLVDFGFTPTSCRPRGSSRSTSPPTRRPTR
jgi:hypothetical protein